MSTLGTAILFTPDMRVCAQKAVYCKVYTCVDTPVGVHMGSMHMYKWLHNDHPCLETSVSAPPKSVCMSRRLFNVSHSTISVDAGLRAVVMLRALCYTCAVYKAQV